MQEKQAKLNKFGVFWQTIEKIYSNYKTPKL